MTRLSVRGAVGLGSSPNRRSAGPVEGAADTGSLASVPGGEISRCGVPFDIPSGALASFGLPDAVPAPASGADEPITADPAEDADAAVGRGSRQAPFAGKQTGAPCGRSRAGPSSSTASCNGAGVSGNFRPSVRTSGGTADSGRGRPSTSGLPPRSTAAASTGNPSDSHDGSGAPRWTPVAIVIGTSACRPRQDPSASGRSA